MQKYSRYLPVLAVILLALGLNLDRFGIDLEALARGDSSTTQTSSGQPSVDPAADAGELLSVDTGTQASASNQPYDAGPHWSTTDPNINLWHIFEGEINRSGKPVGYHSRPQGRDVPNARVVSVRDGPNRSGVYTATIEIRDGEVWKRKFSTFFPDELSRAEVIDVILHAYANSNNSKAQPWEGPSGLGFTIQGYTSSRGGINTAYPIYTR